MVVADAPSPGLRPVQAAARRRVLLATPWYPTDEDPVGGSFCRDNASALRRAGHDPIVLHVSPVAQGRSGPRLIRARYPATRRGALPIGLARAVQSIAAAIRSHRPDLIHAHVALPVGAAAALVGRATRRPVVLTEHTGPFASMLGSPMRDRLVRWTLGNVDAVVPVSRALEAQMRPYLSARVPLELIPNPVDVDAFAEAVAPPPRADRVLFVGRLAPEKRLNDLLAALEILRRTRPRATLRIVGGGPEHSRLSAAIAPPLPLGEGRGEGCSGASDPATSPQTTLVGALNRAGVARELAACDVVALPSQVETFGVALVEALAAGRPVVATRCGGPIEIVAPEVGALVDVGDVPALAAALDRVLAAEHDAAALSHYAERWNFGAIAAELTALYDRVLGGR